MIVIRQIITVGVGLVLIFPYGGRAIAQEVTALNLQKPEKQNLQSFDQSRENTLGNLGEDNMGEYAKEGENNQSLVVELENSQIESESENQPISQTLPGEQPKEDEPEQIETLETRIKKDTAPKYLNPSANPLIFPTKPEEVKIETVEPITLEQAIELALRNNKELQATKQQLERARDELNQALAAIYPTLDTQVNFSRADSATTARSNEQQKQRGGDPLNGSENTTVDGRLELNYDVYTGGRRGADIARAEKQIAFNQLEVERIGEQIRFEASSNYYQLQSADAQVAIEQAAVEDATQTLRDAQLLEQAGLGTRFDVLRAEVELANANQALTQAISNQRTARRQLAETLSLSQNMDLSAADPISEAGQWKMSLDETIVMAYKNRAELEQLLVRMEINEQQKEIALADIRPQVSFFANYNFFDDFDDTVGVTDGYQLGARIQWRFFDGGRALSRVDQFQKDIEIAETNFADQRNQIRFEVERAYYELIANKENIGTAEKAVETAVKSLRLARLRFQAGVGTQTDVINSQTELTRSRGNFLRAIIGYNQSLNALQRSVSNLPDNRLFELP